MMSSLRSLMGRSSHARLLRGVTAEAAAGQTLPRPVQTGPAAPQIANRMEYVMGFGGPIGLIVVGLILALAFDQQQVGPLNVTTLGWILVLAGALWLVLTIVQQNTKRRHTTTATTTDAEGRQASTQRTTESDPPAPPAV
jgi:NhaP-type Na+/H+ or K+/H+ antiporter